MCNFRNVPEICNRDPQFCLSANTDSCSNLSGLFFRTTHHLYGCEHPQAKAWRHMITVTNSLTATTSIITNVKWAAWPACRVYTSRKVLVGSALCVLFARVPDNEIRSILWTENWKQDAGMETKKETESLKQRKHSWLMWFIGSV